MANLQDIANSVINGQSSDVSETVQEALDNNVPVQDILNEGLIGGMNVVGTKFKNNEFYIPEVLIAARAMKAGLELIRPKLLEQKVKSAGKVCIGTVKGDLHDIGKNLVGMMLEGAGFEVIDLGVDVAPETFVASVRKNGIQIVCMSALLTTTMASLQTTVEALKSAGLMDSVRIMIGGAPITQEYATKIGAHGYAADAASATTTARELVAELTS